MKNSKLIIAWNQATPSSDAKEKMLQNIAQRASAVRDAASRRHPLGGRTVGMQPGISWRLNRRTLVLGVLILGLLSATAFAISQQVRFVDWQGKPTADPTTEDGSQPVLMTEEDTALMHARAKKAKELLKNAPDDEIWMAEIWEETQVSHPLKAVFDSLENMRKYIKDTDQELLIPAWIPDGYHFDSGWITYFASPKTHDAGLQQLGEVTTDDGILIKKFRALGPYESDIERFDMVFCDDQGSRLVFYCNREESGSRYYFNLGEEGKSEAISIEGMTEGLFTRDTGSEFPNELYLKKEGMSPKTYYPWPIPYTYSVMDERPAVPFDYDSAAYTIRADNLGREQLQEIALNLK